MCLNRSLAFTQQSLSSHWLLQGILRCRTMTSCCCSQHVKAGKGEGGRNQCLNVQLDENKKNSEDCASANYSFLCFCPTLGMFSACKARRSNSLFIFSQDNFSFAFIVLLGALQKFVFQKGELDKSCLQIQTGQNLHLYDGSFQSQALCKGFLNLERLCWLGFSGCIV